MEDTFCGTVTYDTKFDISDYEKIIDSYKINKVVGNGRFLLSYYEKDMTIWNIGLYRILFKSNHKKADRLAAILNKQISRIKPPEVNITLTK